MPDFIDTILRHGSAAVAAVTRPAPAEAIRARGDQRRRRKAAGSALLALVVLAGGAAGANAAISSLHRSQDTRNPTLASPSPHPGNTRSTPTPARSATLQVHMLPAGSTGARSAIPWSLVGPGWTLATYFTGTVGNAVGSREELYLLDPAGGRYRIWHWTGTGTGLGEYPTLAAWSGNGDAALLLDVAMDGNASLYTEVSLRTGQVSAVSPGNVAGFTRPDGTNILAVSSAGSMGQQFLLQRYSLSGTLQATLATLRNRSTRTTTYTWLGCQGCSAVSSPDGTEVVWSDGTGLQLVSNAGGLIRDLPVPGYSRQPSCVAVRWWDPQTILAACYTQFGATSSDRLWLVPADGSAPTALTTPSGAWDTSGYFSDAWELDGATYVVQTDFSKECTQGAGGPEPVGLFRMGPGGAMTPVTPPDGAGHLGAVLRASQDQLLVLAETSCSGTGPLLSFDPATGVTQTLQGAPARGQGVIAAIPFGG